MAGVSFMVGPWTALQDVSGSSEVGFDRTKRDLGYSTSIASFGLLGFSRLLHHVVKIWGQPIPDLLAPARFKASLGRNMESMSTTKAWSGSLCTPLRVGDVE